MLRELKRLHAELLAGIARLEALALDPRPDPETLARLRTELGSVSTARHEFLENAVFPALAGRALGRDAVRLDKLRAATDVLRMASGEHIRKWGNEAIASDWRGYQRASNAMRRSMRSRVAEEMSVLYPMLERLEI